MLNFVLVFALLFLPVCFFMWARRLVKENARMRQAIGDREDIAEDVADDRYDLRQRLDEAEHAVEVMKLTRTPEGVEAMSERAAQTIDDLFARGGFDSVVHRREAIARVIASCIIAAIHGE